MGIYGIFNLSGIELTDCYLRIMSCNSFIRYIKELDESNNEIWGKYVIIDYTYAVYKNKDEADANPQNPITNSNRIRVTKHLEYEQNINVWQIAYNDLKTQTDYASFNDI